jgi:hypothetical protein
MQTRHEVTDRHERMRLERCQHILDLIEDGTLPNLVFSDEKKFDIEQCVNRQNDSSESGGICDNQNSNTTSQSYVRDGLSRGNRHWEVPIRFCPLRSEIEQSAIHFGYFGSCVVTLGP